MAKGSGIGEIIGLGIAGVGVWWVGGMFGWWSGLGTPAASPPATAPPASGATQQTQTQTPAQLTAADAASFPYSGSVTAAMIQAIDSGVISALNAGQIPTIGGGSVLAYMLGWGGASPGQVKSAGGYNYSYDGANWQLQGAVSSGGGGTSGGGTSGGGTSAGGTQPASVQLVGPVSSSLNNSLKGTFNIGGTQISLAVIPGGGAYNDSGSDVTSTLAQEGVTPAQLYQILQSNYKPATAPTNSTLASLLSQFNALIGGYVISPQPGLVAPIQALALQIKGAGGTVPSNPLGLSGYGMGGPMVFATRKNYVRRGAPIR